MAKVTGLHQSPRAPSFRRTLYFRPSPSGVVAASYPLNRKRKLSPKQQEAVEKFREAAIIAKYAPAADQIRSRQLAKGSQFLPRDLQYLAIYGRLCTLFFTNGERVYQLASRYDLTELLDILGFEPGTVLFRGPEFWEALPPGFEGAALVIENGMPVWGIPGGGGGGQGGGAPIMTLNGLSNQTSAYATKGSIIVPRQDFWCEGVGCVTTGSGTLPNKRAVIAELDGTSSSAEVIDMTAIGPWDANTNTAPRVRLLPLDNPVLLLEGKPYLLGVTWDANTDNAALSLYYSTNPVNAVWFSAPADSVPSAFYYLTRDLDVSMVPNFAGELTFAVWPMQVTPDP